MRSFPTTRLRRNRSDKWLRDLLAEYQLTSSDLVLPLFVMEGENNSEKIKTLPGIKRFTIDLLLKQVELAIKSGINAVALFPVVSQELKTESAEEAYNPNNLICRTVREIKKNFKDQIGIITDVALDPYNSLGHDGLVVGDKILNDETLEILAKQSLVLAEAGADIIAPSDMMDGRIGVIRKELDKSNFHDVKILSYAVKYSSNFYGPFRDAVGSQGNLAGASKDTYQMSYRNSSDIFAEIEMDINEGADFVMVKPAMAYLDIIKTVKNNFKIPIFAYQVSGEYAYLKAAAEKGYLNYNKTLIESLTACKRSGTNAILCYDAIHACSLIK